MKVALVNPGPTTKGTLYIKDQGASGRAKADYVWPPLDLMLVADALKKGNISFKLFDLNAQMFDHVQGTTVLENYKPSITIILTSMASLSDDSSFCEKIKNSIDTYVGLTGIFSTIFAKEILQRNRFIDFYLFSYIPEKVIDIYNFYSKRNSSVPENVLLNLNGKILYNQARIPELLELTPLHEAIDIGLYSIPDGKRKPMTSTITSIGCPYRCTYCTTASVPFRLRPIDHILDELTHAVNDLGVKEILFRDDTFTLSKKNAKKICEGIIQRGLDISWICSSRADKVDAELLSLMYSVGCHTIHFGAEFGSQRILDIANKRIKLEQIQKAISTAKKNKIQTLAHFILGYPGERENDLRATIDFAKKINPDYASFNICVPYIGTELFDIIREKGYLLETEWSKFDTMSSPVFETPELPREVILAYLHKAYREFYFRPAYLIKKFISWRSLINAKNEIPIAFHILKEHCSK